MKRHVASVLIVATFLAVAYALGGSGAATETITSAALTINVGAAHFMEIYNFTQVGSPGQRGVVIVGVFPTPTPTPTLSTIAGGTAIIGGTLTDTAILSGDVSPTGTITFTLFQDSTNTVVDTEMVTVTGNGDYVTPTGTPAPAIGTYVWSATYSGDSNNGQAIDNGQNETETVTTTPTPVPTPTPTPTPIVTTALTATIIDSAAPPEFIKPIIIQGPAVLTIEPVPGATLSITYRKFAESTPAATATPTTTPTSSTTDTTTTTGTVDSGAATITETTTLDEDTDSSTPTPTPATPPASMSTPTPTPTATPSETPTPSPTATPMP